MGSQPSTPAGRETWGPVACGLEVADEEIELRAEEDVEQDEQALHDEADALRTVGGGAAHGLLFGLGGFGRRYYGIDNTVGHDCS